MSLFEGQLKRLEFAGRYFISLIIFLISFSMIIFWGALAIFVVLGNPLYNTDTFQYNINIPIDMLYVPLYVMCASGGFVIVLLWLIHRIYMLSISAKRLRDLGHNPWWTLIVWIPIVAFPLWLYLLFAPSKIYIIQETPHG